MNFTAEEARVVVDAMTAHVTTLRDTKGLEDETYRKAAELLARIEEYYFD